MPISAVGTPPQLTARLPPQSLGASTHSAHTWCPKSSPQTSPPASPPAKCHLWTGWEVGLGLPLGHIYSANRFGPEEKKRIYSKTDAQGERTS